MRLGIIEGRSGRAMSAHVRRSMTQQGAEAVRYGYRLECTRLGAHWRQLMNTNEPSMCGGYAALCQITLTTCLL